jgi:sialate O-acetylesterase
MPVCPSGDVSLQNLPTTLYNAVVHPLASFALSGVVWYQGESNTGNPAPYADYLTKLLRCWRNTFRNHELPFCIVQLANYDGRQQTGYPSPIVPQYSPVNSNWTQLREAQRTVVANDDYAELACIIDLGETVDIHPLRKKEVAERIGLCFDRLVFKDKKAVLPPKLLSTQIHSDLKTITLKFDQPLRPCGELFEYEVAGKDGRFVNAKARSEGNTVIITSPVEGYPCRLRHAWKDDPVRLNTYGVSGLPIGPFEMNLDFVIDYHPHQ